MKNVYEQVEENIDNLVVSQSDWTASATDEELNSAKNGRPILHFYDREIPEDWLKNIKGNMCDLSMFADESFDLIVNPPSLMYIPDLSLVYKECYRVLKNGGQFIIMAPNPVNYLCDWVNDENGGYYKAIHKMPWCSKDYDDSEWIEYGHSMEEYLA